MKIYPLQTITTCSYSTVTASATQQATQQPQQSSESLTMTVDGEDDSRMDAEINDLEQAAAAANFDLQNAACGIVQIMSRPIVSTPLSSGTSSAND